MYIYIYIFQISVLLLRKKYNQLNKRDDDMMFNIFLTCTYKKNLFIFLIYYISNNYIIFILISVYKLYMTIRSVRTRFVTNHNSVGLARKNALTISFVEHGFERLDLGHQAVGFS